MVAIVAGLLVTRLLTLRNESVLRSGCRAGRSALAKQPPTAVVNADRSPVAAAINRAAHSCVVATASDDEAFLRRSPRILELRPETGLPRWA